jgi:serine/threonine protein kinase
MMSERDTDSLSASPEQIGPYSIMGMIGEGAFASVYLCQDQRNKEFYACKIILKARLLDPELRNRFEIEVRVHQQVHHPGVIQLFDLFQDALRYYLILEFCPNGDLFQAIVQQSGFSELVARPMVRQILEALQCVHSLGISHRDLKPENILLGKYGHIKLSDFGLSKFMQDGCLVQTACGSPCYASPECISGFAYNGITTDVWSVGVIVYAMVTGALPWTATNQVKLFEQISTSSFRIPRNLSEFCRSFIRGLLTVDIHKRLTIQQALEHPWIAGQRAPKDEDTTKMLSLKNVDRFFGVEGSSIEFSKGIQKVPSTPSLSLQKTIVLITDPVQRKLNLKKLPMALNPLIFRARQVSHDPSRTQRPPVIHRAPKMTTAAVMKPLIRRTAAPCK